MNENKTMAFTGASLSFLVCLLAQGFLFFILTYGNDLRLLPNLLLVISLSMITLSARIGQVVMILRYPDSDTERRRFLGILELITFAFFFGSLASLLKDWCVLISD